MLDPDEVLERFLTLGVEKVSYSGGEPAGVRDIERALRRGQELGLHQVLTSNGDYLDPPPKWLDYLEYLKLSVYGPERLHNGLMGAGHYEMLIGICQRLIRRDVTVGINYMLTPLSVAGIDEALGDWVNAGANDVLFQTYIENNRPVADQRFRISDPTIVITQLRDRTTAARRNFRGGVKVQNYALSDWYAVLTELGALTLPRGGGDPDWVMGDFRDEHLVLPGGITLPAAAAMDQVWRTRLTTEAIVVL
jgi:MoaA/NifB/PqqE/SkfB family radical SAM enzyme